MLKAIVTGYMYKKIGGGNHTIDTIAEQEEKSGRYIVRIINIWYLNTQIIESIFRAEHNEDLTVMALENISASSTNLKMQEREFVQYQ